MKKNDQIKVRLSFLFSLVLPHVTTCKMGRTKRGSPNLAIYAGDEAFSVMYFATTKKYVVHHPFPSKGRKQTKTKFSKPEDIVELFKTDIGRL